MEFTIDDALYRTDPQGNRSTVVWITMADGSRHEVAHSGHVGDPELLGRLTTNRLRANLDQLHKIYVELNVLRCDRSGRPEDGRRLAAQPAPDQRHARRDLARLDDNQARAGHARRRATDARERSGLRFTHPSL
jgi:hypothetical protein